MQKKIIPLNPAGLSTCSLNKRKSRVNKNDFSRPWKKGGSFSKFLESLPNILGASDLRDIISAISIAHRNNRMVMLGMGAHVIKVGLSPVLIHLMENKVLNMISMNGAGIIHDFEIAYSGATSEDVAASLGSGEFGMAKETGEFLSNAVRTCQTTSLGIGEAVGKAIFEAGLPHLENSILAMAYQTGIPVTVHVAMGTDIIHMHPGFDPCACGTGTHRDFLLFAGAVSGLSNGVYINAGSSVVMPEVFLKALTLARNLGHEVKDFTTVNLDFIRHYRPMTNVVTRPTLDGGKGYHITGHHEILLPLIAAGVIESLDTF